MQIKALKLLQRLDEIGSSLKNSEQALALIALGSVGIELDRLDQYSDLDFFVIAKPGAKFRFLHNLDWLNSITPVAYCFQNTADGYKLLFEDGIFCEFAIFEAHEMSGIPFSAGRIVWKAEGVDDSICIPLRKNTPEPRSEAWLLGEALTCLYVGLNRLWRGEKLSAQRFIQHFAVDRVIELSPVIACSQDVQTDIFAPDRRYEQQFPQLAPHLVDFIQGYERSLQSARAILAFLNQNFEISPVMAEIISDLCENTTKL